MKDRDRSSKITERIVRESGVPDLMELLCDRMNGTDLQSLLLEIHRRRAAQLSPAAVLKQYQQNRFVRPAKISARDSADFDQLAYSLLPAGFEVIELSPVSPLGSCSVIATVDQNNVVTTSRNTEVCADPTNVLALECAVRRKNSSDGKNFPVTRLCASHRVLRAQLFEGPVSFAHFRVFTLCTAGRDQGSSRFEIEALCEQVDFYLQLLLESRKKGFQVDRIRVSLTPFKGGEAQLLDREIIAPLSVRHPEAAFGLDEQRQTGRGYYGWAGFRINVKDPEGREWLIIDGGFTNWTEKLMSDRKERLLISGMGTDRFLLCFR